MATPEELAAVKRYMRIDGDEENGLIEALYAAASLYLDRAGIQRPATSPPLYDLALWSLTLHYYDHRDAVENETAFPVGLRPIINQLKLTTAVPETDT